MKSLQVLVGRSKLTSVVDMTARQTVVFSELGKGLDAHKYGDVVSLGKLLENYCNSNDAKIDKLSLNKFCTARDVQDVINFIYNVQTVGLEDQLVPVIIGQLEGVSVSAIQIKFEKKENVLTEKAKEAKAKKMLTADAIAQRVVTLCNDNGVSLSDVFDLLLQALAGKSKKEEDAVAVSEKIA